MWDEWFWSRGSGHPPGCWWSSDSDSAVSHNPFSTPTPPPRPLASDYIIKEKTVLLQKKDSEGFGFVLRGAKGECRPGRRWEKGSLTQGDGQGKGPQPTHHPTPACWSLSYGEASVTWV